MRPRFRADLVTVTAEKEGVSYVEVRDPATGNTFQFYDFEYALAQQLDGRPMEVVRDWTLETYGVELTLEALGSFVEQLATLGFLEGASPLLDEPLPASAANREGVAIEGASISQESAPGSGASFLPGGTRAEGPVANHPGPFPLASDSAAPPIVASRDETPIASIAHAIVAEMEGRAPALAAGEAVVSQPPAAATFIHHRPPRIPRASEIARDAPGSRAASSEGAGDGMTTEATLTSEAARAIRASAASPPLREFGESPASATTDSWVSHLRAEVEEAEWAGPDPAAAERSSPQASLPPSSTSGFGFEGTRLAGAVQAADTATGASARGPATAAAGRPTRPEPGMIVSPPAAEASAMLALPRRRFPTVLAALGIVMAIAAVAWFLRPDSALEGSAGISVPTVHVVSPQPTTFHRWFPTTGVVVPGRDQTLGFAVAGRIQDVLAPGTTFSAGDSIARLKGVAERELVVNRLRSRIAFLEQLRSSSLDGGNKAAVHDAELKLAARKRELALATSELAKLEIRPAMAGTIAEVLAEVGSAVAAEAPILRLRAAGPHAVFALAPSQLTAARELTFCRLETIPSVAAEAPEAPQTPKVPDDTSDAGPAEAAPRVTDCTFPAPPAASTTAAPASENPGGSAPASAPDARTAAPAPTAAGTVVDEPARPDFEGKLVLGLPAGTTIPAGTQVRLASARFESVFPIPQSAVVRQDGADRVWVLTGAGHHTEARSVEVASTEKGVALVAHGVRAGDAVLVDPPASLKSGDPVYVVQ